MVGCISVPLNIVPVVLQPRALLLTQIRTCIVVDDWFPGPGDSDGMLSSEARAGHVVADLNNSMMPLCRHNDPWST
jgi:hypothetical protein